MEQTTWAIYGDDDTVREIQGRKFGSIVPMLCSNTSEKLSPITPAFPATPPLNLAPFPSTTSYLLEVIGDLTARCAC